MNTLPSETRLAILARMAKVVPAHTLGRTKLMKLCYFLQELKGVPLGYDFGLFNYGPYQSEVLNDLATACFLGIVEEKTIIYPRSYGYDIAPTSKADQFDRELLESRPDIASSVDEVVREFGSFSAGELELRSTILFVDREIKGDGKTTTDSDLADRVEQIKPHFSKEMILVRIREMKEKGWLDSARC
jgi:uncharacterized protein YwgA